MTKTEMDDDLAWAIEAKHTLMEQVEMLNAEIDRLRERVKELEGMNDGSV